MMFSFFQLDEVDDKENEEESTSKEIRSQGSVKGRVYLEYFLAGGSWLILIILFLANVMTQVLFSGSDYWLQYWWVVCLTVNVMGELLVNTDHQKLDLAYFVRDGIQLLQPLHSLKC